MLHPADFLSPEQEKARYELHNNDVNDPKYQAFVAPVADDIKGNFNPEHEGLDFGCGTGPVITKLLRDEHYNIVTYDPFFCNDTGVLNSEYDYIVCCEVIEHFTHPAKEFMLLKSLLKPGGYLYCMTELFHEDLNFSQWYYKNDETHAFFYHHKAIQWIKTTFNFTDVIISGRLIKFKA